MIQQRVPTVSGAVIKTDGGIAARSLRAACPEVDRTRPRGRYDGQSPDPAPDPYDSPC